MAAEHQTVDITVALNKDLKASGEELLRGLGMNWSTAFNASISYSVRQGRLSFGVDLVAEAAGAGYSSELEAQDSFFNRPTQAEIHERIAEAQGEGDEGWISYETLKQRAADV